MPKLSGSCFPDEILILYPAVQISQIETKNKKLFGQYVLPPIPWKKPYLVFIHLFNLDTAGFQFRNEQFFARSRKTRVCAETYDSTPHKETRSLTPTLRKRAIYGWKPPMIRSWN